MPDSAPVDGKGERIIVYISTLFTNAALSVMVFDRKLLGKLRACAWTCLCDEVRNRLGRDEVVPGMNVAIQTHGELLHWHPHIHALMTCGAFTPECEFLERLISCYNPPRIVQDFNPCERELLFPTGSKYTPEIGQRRSRVGSIT